MVKNLRCKRTTTTQDTTTGIRLSDVVIVWTMYVNVIPENLLSTMGFRETARAIETTLGRYTVIHGDNTLDIKVGDILVEVVGSAETSDMYRVLTVQVWPRATAFLLESIE
jgi:hypothetical protein